MTPKLVKYLEIKAELIILKKHNKLSSMSEVEYLKGFRVETLITL